MKNILKLKRIRLLFLLPATFIISLIAKETPSFSEWYAKTIYYYISKSINFITSLIPFSIAEFLIILLILIALTYIVIYILKFIKNKESRKETVFKFILNPLCFSCIIYFIFVVFCSINYSRYPFAQTCGLEVKPSSKTELTELCNQLVDDINKLRQNVKTDNKKVMMLNENNIYLTAKEAQIAFDKLSDDYPLLRAGYGQPKPVFMSRFMSYCNITGIFFPFTFESNVNTDVPDYTIPSVMCHELSHLRGYMREDEANFIGYLACKKSDSADFKYSGKMLAFINASNALYRTDQKDAEKIFLKLSTGVKRDLINNSEYWEQFEGPVAETATKVNDSYLKANNQQDGVKSYGRMVDLLLAEYRKNK